MDHIRHGTTTRWFVSPPKLPDDEFIEGFADGLEETIPEKLQELMALQDALEEERKEKYKILETHKPPLDEFSYYFWSYLFELEFNEYFSCQKWIKYWLRLAEKVSKNKDWIALGRDEYGLSENEIETAKEYPLEDIFEGKLRQVGSARFVGCCPFHEETTASFTIYTNDNSFYCFGCNKWGSSVDLYMHLHKVDFVAAVKALQ